MKLNDILRRAVGWYEDGVCVYLRSKPGRGKSETISAVPAILSQTFGKRFGITVINGGALTIADATGYLIPYTDPNGVSFSQFTRPFWWMTTDNEPLENYDGGIIFVDEADKLGVDEKKIMGEAALSGRLAAHVLPKGWVVWMAGNTAADRSGSTKELDHLINRRMEVEVSDDVESFKDYCWKNGVMAETIAFAEQNPHIVFTDTPDVQGPWCTPRSLVKTDKYLQRLAKGGALPDDPNITEEVGGRIGQAAAAQLFATIRLGQELPKFEEIIAHPETCRLTEKPDARMLVCYSLASRVDAKTIGAVIKYIDRMPPEFSITFAKSATRRNGMLINEKAMMEWCQRNASLMTAITSR